MQRRTMLSVSCAAVLCAAGMAQAQTRWGLLDVMGEVTVPGDSESVFGAGTTIAPPVSPATIPDWTLGNGAGQSKSFLITEVNSDFGVYMYANVQYLLESSFDGNGPESFRVSRTLDVGVVTYENGAPTTNLPTIPFLQQFLPTTAVNEFAKASFNFEAETLCGVCLKDFECDIFEVDTGDGFEEFCGLLGDACIARWLAGDAEATVSFIWDPSGNGGTGSLTVDTPFFSSASGTITPAPSSALLAVLGFGIAARRRR